MRTRNRKQRKDSGTMHRTFEGARIDITELAVVMTPGSSLSIHTIRKAELKRLKGLETLPLAALSLRWLSAVDLTEIALPPSLRELTIWHSNRLTSLAGIEAAADLEELDLRGNGALKEAQALLALPKLRKLSIMGDPPSLQKIASLEFLDGLELHDLTLRAVEGKPLDLGPVARLTSLDKLDLHGPNFAPAELAKVAAAHPAFYEALMALPDAPDYVGECKKCSGIKKKELFLAGKKGHWCPDCEEKGLTKALDEFRAMVANAA